jgi:hypothetical protein
MTDQRSDKLDADFELAVAALRGCTKHVRYGRVHLEVERIAGQTTRYHVSQDPYTDGDLDRLMRERKAVEQ